MYSTNRANNTHICGENTTLPLRIFIDRTCNLNMPPFPIHDFRDAIEMPTVWSHQIFFPPAGSFCHVNIAHQVSIVTIFCKIKKIYIKNQKASFRCRQQPYDKWIFRILELWLSHPALGGSLLLLLVCCSARFHFSFKVSREKLNAHIEHILFPFKYRNLCMHKNILCARLYYVPFRA